MTFQSCDGAMRRCLFAAAAVLVLLMAGAAMATPERGENCTACHTASSMPAKHPPITADTAICTSCHATERSRANDQAHDHDQDRDRHQEQDQDRDQERKQTQVRLGGDALTVPGALRGATMQSGIHPKEHSPVTYELILGYLYSTDIEQHHSGSHLGGGDHGGGNSHGNLPSDEGEGHAGSFFRMGGKVKYSFDLDDANSLGIEAALNRDIFTGQELRRIMARVGLNWKREHALGKTVIRPYLQRTHYDLGTLPSFRAFGLNVNHHVALKLRHALSYTFRAKRRLFDGEDDPRGWDLRTGAVYQGPLGDHADYRLGFTLLSRGNPKKESRQYKGGVLSLGAAWAVGQNATLGAHTELGYRVYDAVDPIFGTTRRDNTIGIGISFQNREWQFMGSAPRFSCFIRRTDSNIATYDSDATFCAVAQEIRF